MSFRFRDSLNKYGQFQKDLESYFLRDANFASFTSKYFYFVDDIHKMNKVVRSEKIKQKDIRKISFSIVLQNART